jgi:hypothetical protein
MASAPDYVNKHFRSQFDKALRPALAGRIAKEFPRIGGERMVALCADLVMEVVERHLRPLEHIRHGQVLWIAVATDSPLRHRQRLRDADLVPVLLDLSIPDDIEALIDRKAPRQRRLQKALRLCEQAHAQGGLLSNCDLAELIGTGDGTIARLLSDHERTTGKPVPRRATLHDVGTALTHKAIIIRQRYRDGKTPDQVARDTRHTLEAVDNYLGTFDRVCACRNLGLTPEQTALAIGKSLRLVAEHLAIDDTLKGTTKSEPQPPEKPGPTPPATPES